MVSDMNEASTSEIDRGAAGRADDDERLRVAHRLGGLESL